MPRYNYWGRIHITITLSIPDKLLIGAIFASIALALNPSLIESFQ
jgi:hypothetical protein